LNKAISFPSIEWEYEESFYYKYIYTPLLFPFGAFIKFIVSFHLNLFGLNDNINKVSFSHKQLLNSRYLSIEKSNYFLFPSFYAYNLNKYFILDLFYYSIIIKYNR
jgi:hypothetical protein